MSYIIENIFNNKTVNIDSLIPYGFFKENSEYTYKKHLKECDLEMIVTIDSAGKTDAKIIDTNFGDVYNLHLKEDTTGGFIGNVRNQYKELLIDIAEKCFENDFIKTDYVKDIANYIEKSHQDKIEYLWESVPDCGIWRRKDNKKWYAALLKIPRSKLEPGYDEKIDILDLRIAPSELDKLVDNKKYFRGYHMNKKHWITIVLDGRIDFEEICNRIETSYELAKK